MATSSTATIRPRRLCRRSLEREECTSSSTSARLRGPFRRAAEVRRKEIIGGSPAGRRGRRPGRGKSSSRQTTVRPLQILSSFCSDRAPPQPGTTGIERVRPDRRKLGPHDRLCPKTFLCCGLWEMGVSNPALSVVRPRAGRNLRPALTLRPGHCAPPCRCAGFVLRRWSVCSRTTSEPPSRPLNFPTTGRCRSCRTTSSATILVHRQQRCGSPLTTRSKRATIIDMGAFSLLSPAQLRQSAALVRRAQPA